jgi:hypothetical protein
MTNNFTMRSALAGLAVVLAACGTTEAPDPLAPSGPQGRIRFVNLITDAARNPVNAILESLPFGVNLAYTQTTPATLPAPSTAFYAAVLTGPRTLVVKRTADTTVTVATFSPTIADGADYTVYAVGGTGGTAVTSIVTTDDNPVPGTSTRARIAHMSNTAGAVDVFLTAAGADLATATPVATNLAARTASAYFTIAAGTYQLRTVPTGTPAAGRNAAVSITQAGLVLAAASGRTIVTADDVTGAAPRRAFVLSDR